MLLVRKKDEEGKENGLGGDLPGDDGPAGSPLSSLRCIVLAARWNWIRIQLGRGESISRAVVARAMVP